MTASPRVYQTVTLTEPPVVPPSASPRVYQTVTLTEPVVPPFVDWIRGTPAVGIPPWPRDRYDEEWLAQVLEPIDGGLEFTPGDMLDVDPDIAGRVRWDDSESPIGATFTCHGPVPVLTEGQLVQPIYRFNSNETGPVEYRLPALSVQGTEPYYNIGQWYDLSLIDQTIDYAGDGIDFPLILPTGTVIMEAAAAVLQNSIPGRTFTLPDLDLTLRNPIEHPTATDPLLIFNELMEAAGCTKLAPVSPLQGGGLASTVWRPATERPTKMVFGPGDGAGFLPDVRTKSDYLATPNVAHYETTGTDTAPALYGTWRDEDPTSPWSIPRRGKRIFAPKGTGEAANQRIADIQAQRIGQDHPGRVRVATIRGGYQPLTHGDIITTDWPDFPNLTATWEIVSANTTTGLGSETVWTIKEVPTTIRPQTVWTL